MKCFKCGRNFDYEKYYGICPKCGCYNKRETAQEQHQQLHDMYDGGYTHTAYNPGGQGGGQPYGGPGNPMGQGGGQPYGGPGNPMGQGGGQPYGGPGNPMGQGGGQPYGGPGNPMGQGGGRSYGYPPGGDRGFQGNIVVREVGRKQKQGGTIFLLICLSIFLLVFIGGTIMVGIYSDKQKESVQREIMEADVPVLEHEPGEEFACQELMIRVTEAYTLGDDSELDIPEGKKLIAVRLEGVGDGSWKDGNRLPDAYIYDGKGYYGCISSYQYEPYGQVYGYPGLDNFAFLGEEYGEGWIGFLLDKEEEEFTFCLEARSGQNKVLLDGIHQVKLTLSRRD